MDINILLAIQDFRLSLGGALDGVFTVFRYLGESLVPVILFAVAWWFGYKKQSFIIFISFYFSIMFNFILKVIFRVPRPFIRDARIKPVESALKTATGYSFPSTHTAIGVAYLCSLGVKYRKKIFVPIIAVIVCCLIAFSRMYMGVHTPQDVLVSLIVGIVIVIVSSKITEWLMDRDDAELILALASLVGFVILLLITLLRNFPDIYFDGQIIDVGLGMQRDLMTMGGALLGFALGFMFNHFFIRYEATDSIKFNIVVSVIGLALVLVIKKFTQSFFEGIGYVYGHALLQTVLILFIVSVWPIVIRFLQKKFIRY